MTNRISKESKAKIEAFTQKVLSETPEQKLPGMRTRLKNLRRRSVIDAHNVDTTYMSDQTIEIHHSVRAKRVMAIKKLENEIGELEK